MADAVEEGARVLDGLMRVAREAASRSPNRTRRTGVAIRCVGGTVVTDCNRFPDGVRDVEERHVGDARYLWIEHAERMAVASCARDGVPTRGATMALPWFPCPECARMIVQSGIARLHATRPDATDPRWGEGFAASATILSEGGVVVTYEGE